MATLVNKAVNAPVGLGFGGRPIGTVSEVKSSQELKNSNYIAPQRYMSDDMSPAQKEESIHGGYLQRNIEMMKGGYRTPTFGNGVDKEQTGGTVFEDQYGANPLGPEYRSKRWMNNPFSATMTSRTLEQALADTQYRSARGNLKAASGRYGIGSEQAGKAEDAFNDAGQRQDDANRANPRWDNSSIYPAQGAAMARAAQQSTDQKAKQDAAEKTVRDQANSVKTVEEAKQAVNDENAAKQAAWNASRDNPGSVATTLAEAIAQIRADKANVITTVEQARKALQDEIATGGIFTWADAVAKVKAGVNDTKEQTRQQNAWNASRDNPNQPNYSTRAEGDAARLAEQTAQQNAWNASRDNPALVAGQNPGVRPNTAPQSTLRNIIAQLGGAGPLGAGGWGGGMNRQPESIFSNTPTMLRGTGNL